MIAIAGLIAAFVIPGLLGMRHRYQLRSSATDVLATFKRVQSEAIKRNARVAIKIDTGTGTCTVFVDDGAGGGVANDVDRNGTEQILFTTTMQPGTAFTNATIPLVAGNPSIEFNSRGLLFTSAGQLTAPVAIDVASGTGISVQYQIALSVTGHVNLLTSTNGGTTFR